MPKTVALIGALDTKGAEYEFVRQSIERAGYATLVIDVGILSEPQILADVSSEEVASAGGATLAALARNLDRGAAVTAMSQGAARVATRLFGEGRLHALMGMGGTGGTAVATAAMRALPLGVPKVMVSTCASGDVSAYVGVHDIVMIPSIVDVAGLNKVSRTVFAQAAGAICGMLAAELPPDTGDVKPVIVASMFGNTTPAVTVAKKLLEEAGYEVLVFHCTGTGGRTMESLVDAGMASGVLDLTTTEWADELLGGVFSAGAARLDAAAKQGTPAIITPACLDMVNFWAPETIPEKFSGRTFYRHNPNVTLMRTNVEECRQLGHILGTKANASTGPVTVLLPLKGLSMIDVEGQPFYFPEANAALFLELKKVLRADIPLIELDCAVNDPVFAERCVTELLNNILLSQTSAGDFIHRH